MDSSPITPMIHSSFRLLAVLFAATLLVGVGDGIYSYRLNKSQNTLQAAVDAQGETIEKLSRSLNDARQTNADLQGEVTFTKERLGSTQVELRKTQQSSSKIAREQQETAKQWNSQLGQLQQTQETTQGTVSSLSSDVAATKDGLNSTREDLQRAVGDLGVQSGVIAKNHDEIEGLRQRGERDYYEFDIAKAKQPQRVGEIAIGIKKVDVKRQRFTINLVADDHTIEKKDKTVNEPVQFYQAGFRVPTEIVVNQIYKDRIVGYVAVPKKKETRTTLSAAEPASFRDGS